MSQVATQFKCECGKLTKPADVAANEDVACSQCDTDAPLLFANEAGEVVPYTAECVPEMQAASNTLSRIS